MQQNKQIFSKKRIVNTQMQHAVPATPTTIHMIGMRDVRQYSRLVNSSQIGLYSVTVDAQNRLLLQIMSSHKFNEQAFEAHSSHTHLLTRTHAVMIAHSICIFEHEKFIAVHEERMCHHCC